MVRMLKASGDAVGKRVLTLLATYAASDTRLGFDVEFRSGQRQRHAAYGFCEPGESLNKILRVKGGSTY